MQAKALGGQVFDVLGKLMFDAVMQRDYPIVMAVSSLSAVMTLLGILFSDLLYRLMDPRTR